MAVLGYSANAALLAINCDLNHKVYSRNHVSPPIFELFIPSLLYSIFLFLDFSLGTVSKLSLFSVFLTSEGRRERQRNGRQRMKQEVQFLSVW